MMQVDRGGQIEYVPTKLHESRHDIGEIARVIHPRALPDGKYPGDWSGCVVRFFVQGIDHRALLSAGVSGKVPCVVVIDQGQTWIEV